MTLLKWVGFFSGRVRTIERRGRVREKRRCERVRGQDIKECCGGVCKRERGEGGYLDLLLLC